MGRRPDGDETDRDDAPLLVRLARFGWRLDALDRWRDEVDRKLALIDDRLDGLVKVDEVAKAVAAQLRKDRAFSLTFVQKCGAFVFAVVVLLGELKALGLPL